jgi:type I restriction enzyme S subunit
MKTKPNLRFSGFTDDWEQRKVSEVAEVIGGGTPSTSNSEYWDGDINWYAPAEIGDQIYVESSERKITKLGLEKSSAKILPAHKTVLFTSRAGIGNTAILRTPAATNQGFQSMVLNDDINPYFVYSMTDMIKAKAERVASGSTFAEISGKMLGNLEFMFPSKPEQDKIGGYFESLDNLITLHQRKLDKLKKIKNAYLDGMFPKNGEKVPRIRFSRFTDDWEQRKLGDISDKVTKKNQDIAVEEVFTNSAEFGIISQRDFFDKDIANAENIDGYYVVEPDDFVYNPRISTTAPFGPIKRNKLERTGAMSPLYYVFRPHDIDLSYLEWFFQTTCWHAFMRFNGNSGARSDRFAITDKNFNEMPISIPQDIEEQKKLGTFLTELDNLITLHQRKLDKLKKLKAAYLNDMFV